MRDYNWGAIAALGFPVGAIAVFLSLIVLTGSVGNAGTLLVMSIVCTLGIALIFWVPLCTGVGMLVVYVAIATYRQIRGTTGAVPPLDRVVEAAAAPTGTSRNVYHRAVADYIRKARVKGYSDSQIDTRLAARGWQAADIDQARALLTTEAAR